MEAEGRGGGTAWREGGGRVRGPSSPRPRHTVAFRLPVCCGALLEGVAYHTHPSPPPPLRLQGGGEGGGKLPWEHAKLQWTVKL